MFTVVIPGSDQVTVEIPDPAQQPLDGLPLIAALNAALGVWSLGDAANIAGVPEQALVDEVTAWAVAGS